MWLSATIAIHYPVSSTIWPGHQKTVFCSIPHEGCCQWRSQIFGDRGDVSHRRASCRRETPLQNENYSCLALFRRTSDSFWTMNFAELRYLMDNQWALSGLGWALPDLGWARLGHKWGPCHPCHHSGCATRCCPVQVWQQSLFILFSRYCM